MVNNLNSYIFIIAGYGFCSFDECLAYDGRVD